MDINNSYDLSLLQSEAEEWLLEWQSMEYHTSIKKNGFMSYEEYIADENATIERHILEREWEEECEREEFNRKYGGRNLDDTDIIGIIQNGGGDVYGF